MRTLILIFCCLALAAIRAEDITLRDGTVLKSATVTGVTPAYISVTYAAGVAHVMLQDLPPELQKKYGYDPRKAADYAAADAAAQQRLAQQQAKERAAQQAAAQHQQATEEAANAERAKEAARRQKAQTESQTIIARVREVADGGAFVEPYEEYAIASHSASIGGGGGVGSGYRPSGRTVFVQGLSGVTDGQSITIRAYRDGTYRSHDESGSQRTLEKWVFVSGH